MNMKKKVFGLIGKYKLILVFLVVFIIASCVSPYFFKFTNMVNLFDQVSAYGIAACGLMFVIIAGEFDISVGSIMCLASTLTVTLLNQTNSWPLTIAVLLVLGVAIGCLYGVLILKLNISSFIATLAGSIFYRGLAYLITQDGKPIIPEGEVYGSLATTRFLSIPSIVYIFLACVVLIGLILKFTRFGRNVYATGSNAEAAKYTGINVFFYKTASFVICAWFAIFAGVMYSSRANSANASVAADAALTAMSGIVLGGASTSGGKGTVWGMFMGTMILGLLTNSFNLMGIDSYVQQVIKGALLIIFISIERYTYNKRLSMN